MSSKPRFAKHLFDGDEVEDGGEVEGAAALAWSHRALEKMLIGEEDRPTATSSPETLEEQLQEALQQVDIARVRPAPRAAQPS